MPKHKGFEPNPLTEEEIDLLLFFQNYRRILYPKQHNAYGVRPAVVGSLIQKQIAKGTNDGYLTLTPRGKRWLAHLKDE